MPTIIPVSTVTPWAALYPDIIAHVPRCTIPEIDARAREAARRFFRDSHCWRVRNVEILTTVALQADYLYNVDAEQELHRVHSAWIGEDEVEVGLPGQVDDRDPAYDDSTWRFEAIAPATIRVSPLPQTAGVVVVGTLGFIPAKNATGILTEVFDEHRYAIASGAVAMLASQPGKPWTNPAIVSYHEGLFMAGVTDASNTAGPVRRKPLRVTPW